MRASLLAGSFAVIVSFQGADVGLAQTAPPRYVVTDVGDLGGGEAIASAINSSGQVVGFSYLAGHTMANTCDERRAFLYENGVVSELPSLPGTRFASASGINDRGEVSGTNNVYVESSACTGGCFPGYCEIQTPVLVGNGSAIDLSAPAPWYAGVANDVSSSGQVVGWSRKSDLPNPRTWHGFLWEKGVRTDLGTLDKDWSIATGINDDGLVVGYSQLVEGGGVWYGFRWNGGVMTPLPALGANTYNGANKVNAAGDAVGWSGPNSDEARPVFYPSSGGVLDLGSLGGTQASAFALNDRGSVVGYSYTTGNQSRHAFLHRDNRLWDLNDLIPAGSGWELMAATDVNDVGQIVGYGCKDGKIVLSGGCVDAGGTPTFRRAFLLTPAVSIRDLQDLVRSFHLPRRLEISLLTKLVVAQILIDAGYTDVACRVLGVFGNQVENESGHGLTASRAALLLQTLSLVRADLGCS
jgi:probable HAF family extracellular repeat protein